MFNIIINFDFNVNKRDNVDRFVLIFQTSIENVFRVREFLIVDNKKQFF